MSEAPRSQQGYRVFVRISGGSASNLKLCVVLSRNRSGFTRCARHWRCFLKPEEIRKLEAYFKRTFNNDALTVKARPRKDDSCELYLGDEFLGIVFKDEEEGELSYNFSMAILDIDL